MRLTILDRNQNEAVKQAARQGKTARPSPRNEPMKTIVAVKNATKDYALGTTIVQALRGVTLEVHEGEFLSIAGPSGSGKTTLLNLIGCVDIPTNGTVEVGGQDTSKLSERALTRLRLNTIGFIFQS